MQKQALSQLDRKFQVQVHIKHSLGVGEQWDSPGPNYRGITWPWIPGYLAYLYIGHMDKA